MMYKPRFNKSGVDVQLTKFAQ